MGDRTCYACDPANPDRIVTDDAGGYMLTFPPRFAGPPGTVNGGLAVGALACAALRTVHREDTEAAVTRIVTRLQRPVPLSTQLHADVEYADYGLALTLARGDESLASATAEVARLPAPPRPGDGLPVSVASDRAAEVDLMADVGDPGRPPFHEETGEHPIPGCCSCGPANPQGLKIFPRFAGHGQTWASWQPDTAFADPHTGGALAATVIASALDCSSGICLPLEDQRELLRLDQFFLLGSLDVRFLRVAPVDPPGGYKVVARSRGRDGRKFYGLSVLCDAARTVYATADAIWVVAGVSRSQAFGSPA
jgi:hypothetical protein